MSALLLLAVLLVSLLLIPFGLPGTWLMVAAAIAYGPLTGTSGIGVITLVGLCVLALVGELIEYAYAMKYTRLYGGSRRAGWGAIIGGILGAIVGLPIPIVGSVFGAFAGAFVGALIAEFTKGTGGTAATRVATGALLGRLVGTAAKAAIGVAIAAWTFSAAVF